MVQIIKSLVLGTVLLVQLVSASKYASSGGSDASSAIYLGSSGGNGGGGDVQQSEDSGSNDALASMFNLANFVQSGPSYQSAGGASVPAAIQTKRTVEVKPVNIPQEPIEPHIVDVEASYSPVHVVFRSSSSPVMVQQIHSPAQAPAQIERTESEDHPHLVQHKVVRPVIQEIREIITPYRKVLQEIRPVQETVHTVVAKAEGSGRVHGSSGEGVLLAHAGNGQGNGGQGSGGQGSSLGGASAGGLGGAGYGSGVAYASAAASVPSPSYTRGRRSSTVRGTQRKSYRRASIVSAKRQQPQQLYASSL